MNVAVKCHEPGPNVAPSKRRERRVTESPRKGKGFLMKISRWSLLAALTLCLCLPACAKRSSSKMSVEGPKNKYSVKLEKTEKD